MPPKRRIPARARTTNTRRSTRRKEVIPNTIPNVYQDMVAEAVASGADYDGEPTPKRRKVKQEATPEEIDNLDAELFGDVPEPERPKQEDQRLPQVIYDDFEGSDDSDDVEFEDVEIGDFDADEKEEPQETLHLDFSKPATSTPSRNAQRRKVIGAAERKIRLDIHKTHLVLLLLAVANRNRWCESETVHAILKPLVPRKTISSLHVDESQPQFQRSHSFNKAIEELCAMWRAEWSITAKGMHRAHWRDDVNVIEESEDAEDFIEFEDFLEAAQLRSGSRDLGAQLFCALLRSVAVETRLVCSLQVLPFSGAVKGQPSEKSKSGYIYAPPQNFDKSSPQSSGRKSRPRKRLVESPYPVFWVEVLSPATSTWIPIDPLVRRTINKPKTGFEPSISDQLNSMSYVLAFEDDDTARDVTRRYAQWYNAKTRRIRVESTKGGERWWRKTMKFFEKPHLEIADEIEDAEFIRRAETEGMPKNVQDFKGHPVYVLERHLRRNEVIQPRREVGKVAAGVSKNAKLEGVFRRRDVHLCRTADAWYRRGRDVRQGEVALKRAIPKNAKNGQGPSTEENEEEEDGEVEGVALYAEYQTDIYEPPPVINGLVPRNAFGNLDVYVPSMIPAGAIHVRHPLAAQAAKVLGTNFVDAVTGFEFKGRQGTAVIDGVVVSQEMRIAMVTVIVGLQSQAAEESEAERARFLLGVWKRWLTALRVRARVEEQYGGNEENDEKTIDNGGPMSADEEEMDSTYHTDEDDDLYQDDDAGGGFMPEQEVPLEGNADTRAPEPVFPTLKPLPALLPPQMAYKEIVVVESPHKLESTPVHLHKSDSRELDRVKADDLFEDNPPNSRQNHNLDEAEGGGFIIEDEADDHGSIVVGHSQPLAKPDEFAEGGFIIEDNANNDNLHQPSSPNIAPGFDEDEGGGFIVDDNDEGEVITHSNELNIKTSGKTETDTKTAASGVEVEIDVEDEDSPLSDTSMLSHDPAEDDADPEWLIDSLG